MSLAPRIHRILVCLDRSQLSEASLPHAISIAKTFESEVTLMHVMRPQRGQQITDAIGWEISRQEARAYLEGHQHSTATALGRPVGIRLEQGHPAERIVGLAHELRADLTILGSHGEDGITAWNLGSTVQQVLEGTPGSVLLAHAASNVGGVAVPKLILVPLDGSLRTESVLPTAARMASAFGAELLLVHVVQEPVASAVLCEGEDLELAKELALRVERRAERYLEAVHDRLVRETPAVRARVIRHPNERQCLLEVSRSERVDLVVVSAHGLACDPARAFGSVTGHLLTYSSVPVLVLQDLPRTIERQDLVDQISPPLRASFAPEAV
jgi:nucleotide-binding universal stress UspA family protein